MSEFVHKHPRHFIAINCHTFHEIEDALACVRSVILSARGMTGTVKTVLFYHSDQPPPQLFLDQVEAMPLEVMHLPNGTNGDCLNDQIMQAQGYDYFYRVDADDLVSEGRFCWQAEQFVTTGCDISGGGLIYKNRITGQEYQVIPPAAPASMAFLMNQFFLHPTLAFRLESFNRAHIRYGRERLEDKGLAVTVVRAGLDVVNDPRIYGVYNLNPDARNGSKFNILSLKYNLSFIFAKRSYWAIPLAGGVFMVSYIFSKERLRRFRHLLTRKTDQA